MHSQLPSLAWKLRALIWTLLIIISRYSKWGYIPYSQSLWMVLLVLHLDFKVVNLGMGIGGGEVFWEMWRRPISLCADWGAFLAWPWRVWQLSALTLKGAKSSFSLFLPSSNLFTLEAEVLNGVSDGPWAWQEANRNVELPWPPAFLLHGKLECIKISR